MATLLRRAGYQSATTPEEADLLIVNTCGFIESAREESREVLQELAEFKGPNQRIVAAGCYSQRCPHELAADVPGIDGLIGTRRWMDILDLVERLEEHQELVQAATSCGEGSQTEETPPSQPIYHIPETPTVGQDTRGLVRAAPQGSSAYLKLADGCRRSCAFCAIPLIKGSAVSRPPEAILADARRLADLGLREIILIAQDTTDYGHDLGMEEGLAQLLEELVAQAVSDGLPVEETLQQTLPAPFDGWLQGGMARWEANVWSIHERLSGKSES